MKKKKHYPFLRPRQGGILNPSKMEIKYVLFFHSHGNATPMVPGTFLSTTFFTF